MKRSFLTSLFIIFAIVIIGAVLGGRSALIKSAVYAQSLSQPELPRVYLDTTCPTMTGAVFNLSAGRQSSIRAQLGAARRYDSSSGGRSLHRKLHAAGQERQRLDHCSHVESIRHPGRRHSRNPVAFVRDAQSVSHPTAGLRSKRLRVRITTASSASSSELPRASQPISE